MSSIPTIREIMGPLATPLTTDMTLEDAEKTLRRRRLFVAPVATPGGNIVACLNDFQLLKCFVKRSQNPQLTVLGNFLTDMETVILVKEEQLITEAFRHMIEASSHRIFVTDKAGALVGSVSPMDMMPFMRGEANDPSRRGLSKEDLGSENGFYYRFFMDAPILMYSLDFEGMIVAANRMLHLVLGYNEGTLIGRTMRDLYPEQSHQDVINGLAKIQNEGYHHPVNVLLTRKDSKLVKADLMTMLRHNDKGVPTGTLTVGVLSEQGQSFDYLKRGASLFKSNEPFVLDETPSPPASA